ncbi:DUF488 domain-containing protein [Ktedonosporobacter rubrisoli]|uniref:DUF488 domain-containing protein n=1 Tax=Ktedonosporobacter rubrisoli TaxID=2509675 RepID=A0A4P6JUF5_KTERU|nr:DUF488 domain-containing protein [Ktedonosporobacter rubrisoli]QBD79278.1 DUF488 domain-containing protein [Ktedonosporobacter rubrisoli]
MYYRRKILLALLEAYGGFLTKIDCQKLVLLFCQRRGKNYYDFFPHTSGNFSLILAQDKSRLTALGLLTEHRDFQLKDNPSYFAQLEPQDRTVLRSLMAEIGNIRGDELIHKVYLELPHYVSRSQLATRILTEHEYEQISRTWKHDHTPCLFTIGYEGLSLDAYLDLLISHDIATLVDVRKNPISMKYGFSKKRLADYTQFAGIDYIHIPDLGIASNLRQQLNDPADYQNLFAFYSSHILPAHAQALEQLKQIVFNKGRVAITCFEADHHFCHRHKITEYLETDPGFNIPISHLHKHEAYITIISSSPPSNGFWEQKALYSSI